LVRQAESVEQVEPFTVTVVVILVVSRLGAAALIADVVLE
jgi:hypothetical protein